MSAIVSQIKSLLTATFSLMPYRACRAIARASVPALDPKDKFELIAVLAPDLNIVRFLVEGTHGMFESLSSDSAVLKGYALNGVWASRTLELACEVLKGTSGTYIDVGANIGLTIIPITKLGPISCFGFEPDPTNFESLKKNAERNAQCERLRLFQLALSDVSGTAAFSRMEGNLGDHQLVGGNAARSDREAFAQTREFLNVEVRPLDSLALEITHPLVVKIDTQGAEPMVLRGGATTIGIADLLIMEFWPWGISRFQNSADDLLVFLATNFKSISCASGEIGDLHSWSSIDKSIQFLRSFFAEQRPNEDVYLDVVAKKI